MTKMKSYTLREFIEAYRPDGLGHIVLDFGDEVTDIPFTEVICDICNAEITQPDDEPDRKVVFVLDTDALCENCAQSHRDDDESSPSSHTHESAAPSGLSQTGSNTETRDEKTTPASGANDDARLFRATTKRNCIEQWNSPKVTFLTSPMKSGLSSTAGWHSSASSRLTSLHLYQLKGGTSIE